MRHGDLDRTESIFVELEAVLPAHVLGRGHRAEVALARGQLHVAMTLIMPLLEISDDPESRAIHAEILTARGDSEAASEAERAAAAYEPLLARRSEAYADHAATFFMGPDNRPQRAVELALANQKIRDTPRRAAFWLRRCATRGEFRRALGSWVELFAIAISAGMRVDELARVPLAFPTYTGNLAYAAATAARQLDLDVGWQASKIEGDHWGRIPRLRSSNGVNYPACPGSERCETVRT